MCAARTSPVSASATIQERAVTSFGSTGTPLARFTCVPARPSRAPPTVDIDAGGVAEGLVDGLPEGLGDGLGAATAAGAARARDDRTAEVTSRDRLAVFLGAGTVGNVHAVRREVPPPSPPRERNRTGSGDTGLMKLSRPVSWFLLAFGVWSWVIWITFVKNLVMDSSGLAFDDGHPTAYFWVHLLLAVVSFVLGTAIGAIGLRGLRALRRTS
ncbi:hypothetical protein GCM10010383_19180 [Streptomyces lomondensis]|uniref:Integral membrane protein n=2 Tax=Streptomyces lomondensis TaxID=68229 RepID=A0ABQ2X0P7_9ACTN|nr:hypothetical protein GCM10010383_19180 [Streptomyces lomondensis]